MKTYDPYQPYTDGNLLSENPLQLVVVLYEGAIEAVRLAHLGMESGDIWGRTRAINKAISILTELMKSINQEKGGEIASNLKQLYSYMQRRLLEAHARKTLTPLEEVARLLDTLADGWKGAAANSSHSSALENGHSAAPLSFPHSGVNVDQDRELPETRYGAYWNEIADVQSNSAYSFSL